MRKCLADNVGQFRKSFKVTILNHFTHSLQADKYLNSTGCLPCGMPSHMRSCSKDELIVKQERDTYMLMKF